jgi:PAP2 superfamily
MLATVFRMPGMSRARRFAGRHYGLIQIAIVVIGVELYEFARHMMDPDWPAAYTNAHRVVSWERFMNIAWEQSLQRAFLGVPDLVKAMNVFYFVGHFVLTSLFFFWLYHTNRDGFRRFRNGFLAATAIALVIHWRFPTAPPRLVAGYVDTLRRFSDIDIGSATSSSFSNPVAAVPSLHAGWALGVGIGLVIFARPLIWKAIGVAYPIAVVLTIVVTGNHYVFDALMGYAVMAVGFLATSPRLWRGRGDRLQPSSA